MDGAIKDVGRAVGGSLLFASPLLMTMEIWEIAPSMPGTRVVVLLFAACVLLVTLAQLSGFNDLEGQGLADHVVDAGVAIAVGTVVSVVLLAAFGVLDTDLGIAAVARRVALGAAPASLGAVFARSQLTSAGGGGGGGGGGETLDADGDANGASGGDAGGGEIAGGEIDDYFQELVVMAAGAVIFAFGLAPTDEIPLIALQTGPIGVIVVLGVSVVALHLLVYAVGFAGSHGNDHRTEFARFTLTGYALVVAICAFLLWVFGRADGVVLQSFAQQVVILAFPASLGAAVGRLVL